MQPASPGERVGVSTSGMLRHLVTVASTACIASLCSAITAIQAADGSSTSTSAQDIPAGTAPADPAAKPAQDPATPLAPEVPTTPVRRALLVGIGEYPPDQGGWPKLSGTLADVEAIEAALIARGGFESGRIQKLIDRQATSKAILKAFDKMIEDSHKGDLILFYFAGHGSRLPDDGNDESDPWDETLVPYDAGSGPSKYNDIRDDKIGELIGRANFKTDQVVLILDCCCSGTITRDGTTNRYLSPAKRGFDKVRSVELLQESQKIGSGYAPPASRYVSLSACRAQQSAFEIEVPTETNGAARGPGEQAGSRAPEKVRRGLFTWCLVEALSEMNATDSYADLMARVSARVARQQKNQTPMIEGTLQGYSLFAPVAAPKAHRYPLTLLTKSGLLYLEAGMLQTLQPGAVLSVCGAEATHDDFAARVGRVRLTEVESQRSRAEWIDPPRLPAESAHETSGGARSFSAFLLEHGQGNQVRLPIAIQGTGRAETDLESRLEGTNYLKRVAPGEAALTLRLETNLAKERWIVHTKGGRTLPLSANPAAQEELDRLRNNLGKLGVAHRTAIMLSNDDSGALPVDFEIQPAAENDTTSAAFVQQDGQYLIDEGREFQLVIRNRATVPVFATIVQISPDGEILRVDPPTEDDRIAASGEQRITSKVFDIDKDLAPFYEDAPVRFFCVVTTRCPDLRSLEQLPVVVGHGARGEALSVADLAERGDPLACEPWTTAVLSVRVRLLAR